MTSSKLSLKSTVFLEKEQTIYRILFPIDHRQTLNGGPLGSTVFLGSHSNLQYLKHTHNHLTC